MAAGLLASLSTGLAMQRDLTDRKQNDQVLALATKLYPMCLQGGAEKLKADALKDPKSTSPLLLEAIYCAESKLKLKECVAGGKGLHLSVIFAMYNETERMQPKEISEHGEDFFRVKAAQLDWLFDGFDATWDMVATDDGCPQKPSSQQCANEIIAKEGWKNVRTIHLQTAIDQGLAVAKGIKTTKDSRKGGSILYGLYDSVEYNKPSLQGKEHIVLYTDSDLSANMAMSGLLCHKIVCDKHPVACGHRYGAPGAVLVKEDGAVCEPSATGDKPDKMIILFRHWVRGQAIKCLAPVMDTQCGFKAFRASQLGPVLGDVTSYNESFDVELLIQACKATGMGAAAIGVVPIVFVEDFECSTMVSSKQVGGKLEPGEGHLKMIKQILAIRDKMAPTLSGEAGILGNDPAFLSFAGGLELPEYKNIIYGLIDKDNALSKAEQDKLFDRAFSQAELQQMAVGTAAAAPAPAPLAAPAPRKNEAAAIKPPAPAFKAPTGCDHLVPYVNTWLWPSCGLVGVSGLFFSVYIGKVTNSHEWKEIFLDYCHHKRTVYSPNPLDKVARSVMRFLKMAPK